MAPIGKKRKRGDCHGSVEELTFNPEARQEYLTGFSKRKQARKDHAKEVAIKRGKEEKIQERKALREQKKQEVEQHVQAVNQQLKKQNALINGDDSEAAEDWLEGCEDATQPGAGGKEMPSDEEYVDEDKYTTVTVEAMNGSGDEEDDQTDERPGLETEVKKPETAVKKKRPWQKDGDAGKKTKKKKFRYESKAERAVTRQKQKSKNGKAANARKKAK